MALSCFVDIVPQSGLRWQTSVVFFNECFDLIGAEGAIRLALCASSALMSSALNSGGSPLLYSSINARIVAVVVKAPSGIPARC